jgi:hypothetical protein
MTNVSRTNRNGKRPKSDLYPTPAEATRAFVRHEYRALRRATTAPIWEPAAGEGDLAIVLRAVGLPVYMSDLYVRPGHARVLPDCRDFMAAKMLPTPGTPIITNPPYSVGDSGDEFVRHALRLRPRYAAFFLPITFLAGLNRADLIEGSIGGLRLARVLVLSWRCTLKPSRLKLKNAGVVTFAWYVWTRGHRGPFTVHRLYRTPEEQARYTGRAANDASPGRYRRVA